MADEEDLVSVLTVEGDEFEFPKHFLAELGLGLDQLQRLLTIDQCFLLANYADAQDGLASGAPLPRCLRDHHGTLHGLDVTKLAQTRAAAQAAGYTQLTAACDQAQLLLCRMPTYCEQEVAAHNGKDGAQTWMVVDGFVYDLSEYLPRHPGKQSLLQAAGKDGTALFLQYHHSGTALRLLHQHLAGQLVVGAAASALDAEHPYLDQLRIGRAAMLRPC